jgi:DNA-binding IclR family transcriptional regulator
MAPSADAQVQTLARALTLVDLLATRGPLTSEQLAEEIGVSHRQVNRLLLELRRAGWVEPAPERRGIRLYHQLTDRHGAVKSKSVPKRDRDAT